jgi:hypothetical protein
MSRRGASTDVIGCLLKPTITTQASERFVIVWCFGRVGVVHECEYVVCFAPRRGNEVV